MPNTFPKHSRLCGQEHITALYKQGKRFTAWPLRVTYLPTEEQTQILVELFQRWQGESPDADFKACRREA